ncbi:hypothetical protein ACSBR2_026804 [Camellia fascicularis]
MKNDDEIRTEVCSTMKRPEFLTSKNSLKIQTSLKIPWLNCFKAVDMDITFKALKETNIGRHVNRLWKNPSNDVRRLVKQLVRKWKDLLMETLLSRTYHLVTPEAVPDFAYSPNPHNGSSGSDKNNSEPEPKAKVVPRRDAPPAKLTHSIPLAASAPPRKRQQDLERPASTRKRFMRITRKLRIDTLLYFGFTSILFGLYFCHKRTF